MMAFSGPSNHRCKCFGEGDGREGSWYPCPPELCEADVLLARLQRAEKALKEILNAEPDEGEEVTYWPSFAGRLQSIAGNALLRAHLETEPT